MSVDLILFNKDKHLDLLKSWFKKRNLNDINALECLPPNGYIAIINDKPVAAGFLRLAEGNTAFLDSFIADSEATTSERDEALYTLAKCLIEACKGLNVKNIMSISSSPTMIERAIELGFKKQQFQVFTL